MQPLQYWCCGHLASKIRTTTRSTHTQKVEPFFHRQSKPSPDQFEHQGGHGRLLNCGRCILDRHSFQLRRQERRCHSGQ